MDLAWVRSEFACRSKRTLDSFYFKDSQTVELSDSTPCGQLQDGATLCVHVRQRRTSPYDRWGEEQPLPPRPSQSPLLRSGGHDGAKMLML